MVVCMLFVCRGIGVAGLAYMLHVSEWAASFGQTEVDQFDR